MKLVRCERNGVLAYAISDKEIWNAMAAETGEPYCVIYNGLGAEVNQATALHVVPFNDLNEASLWARTTMPDDGENWWVILENGIVVDECS